MTSEPMTGAAAAAGHPAPGSAADPLVDVWLLGYPIVVGVRASQHYEEVFREFALLAASAPGEPDSVPVRLLALVDALGRRYARQERHEVERDEAFLRGERQRDFTISVPVSAGAASETLDAMLDETDDYCRAGMLLTLAAADDVVAFRRWYLHEVTRQIHGAEPTPWPGPLS